MIGVLGLLYALSNFESQIGINFLPNSSLYSNAGIIILKALAIDLWNCINLILKESTFGVVMSIMAIKG